MLYSFRDFANSINYLFLLTYSKTHSLVRFDDCHIRRMHCSPNIWNACVSTRHEINVRYCISCSPDKRIFLWCTHSRRRSSVAVYARRRSNNWDRHFSWRRQRERQLPWWQFPWRWRRGLKHSVIMQWWRRRRRDRLDNGVTMLLVRQRRQWRQRHKWRRRAEDLGPAGHVHQLTVVHVSWVQRSRSRRSADRNGPRTGRPGRRRRSKTPWWPTLTLGKRTQSK